MAVVSSLLIPSTTKVALAATGIDPEKVIDPGIGCGNKYWGIKTDTDLAGTWAWGKNTDCSVNTSQPAIGGRTNYVKIYADHDAPNEKFSISWQAIIQGKDPWGNDGSLPGGTVPQFPNTSFPALATNDYTLKAQWYWTNNQRPATQNLFANYLTNLWLKSDNNLIVIDFLWMQLKPTTTAPYDWMQNIVTDQSSSVRGNTANPANGVQYYQPSCHIEGAPGGGTTHVYHYNIVLDNTSHGSNQWIEQISNINSYISNAISYSGYTAPLNKNGEQCSILTPNIHPNPRSYYTITGIETGIELSAAEAGANGRCWATSLIRTCITRVWK